MNNIFDVSLNKPNTKGFLVALLLVELVGVIYLISLHPKKIAKIKECNSYSIISIFMLYLSMINLYLTCAIIVLEELNILFTLPTKIDFICLVVSF